MTVLTGGVVRRCVCRGAKACAALGPPNYRRMFGAGCQLVTGGFNSGFEFRLEGDSDRNCAELLPLWLPQRAQR